MCFYSFALFLSVLYEILDAREESKNDCMTLKMSAPAEYMDLAEHKTEVQPEESTKSTKSTKSQFPWTHEMLRQAMNETINRIVNWCKEEGVTSASLLNYAVSDGDTVIVFVLPESLSFLGFLFLSFLSLPSFFF